MSATPTVARGGSATPDLRLAYVFSLLLAVLMALVSVAGFVFAYERLYRVDPEVAANVTPDIGACSYHT